MTMYEAAIKACRTPDYSPVDPDLADANHLTAPTLLAREPTIATPIIHAQRPSGGRGR